MMNQINKKHLLMRLCLLFYGAGVFSQGFGGQQALEQLRLFKSQADNGPAKTQNSAEGMSKNLDDFKKTLNMGDNKTSPSTQTPQANLTPAPEPASTPPVSSAPVQPPQLRTQGNVVTHEDEDMIDKLAYDQVESQIFPMSEHQIKDLHAKYQDIELAKTAVPSPPKPVATSQFVNLSPGSTPPVIRLGQGFVTSLVFLDSTGAPWPISAYDLGDPASFNIQWDKTGNTLMIQASKLYNYGNMAVRLEGLNTPVMLTLIPGQKEVDYRVDMRVQGMGPNALMPVFGDGLPPSANRLLLHVLDGVPPPGSTRLTVSGGDARAWLYKEKMYVRTNLTILSPAWLSTMTSGDGMHAYEMQKSPVILVTWHGKVMQLKVEGL